MGDSSSSTTATATTAAKGTSAATAATTSTTDATDAFATITDAAAAAAATATATGGLKIGDEEDSSSSRSQYVERGGVEDIMEGGSCTNLIQHNNQLFAWKLLECGM